MLVFFGFISEFNGAILSAVDDVPVDSEAPVMTSSISRFAGPTQFSEVLIGVVCVRVFIRVSMRSCI